MSDFDSSLPIRTENPGDVSVKIVDSLTPTQGLAVDSSGKTSTKLNDGTGNLLASLTTAPLGTEQALVVRNIPSGDQVIHGNVAAAQDGVWTVNVKDAAGVAFSSANPLPVAFSADVLGNEVLNYQTTPSVAGAASSNHDYTVSSGKTLLLKQVEASASSKCKIEIQVETGVATNLFNTIAVQFNSTAAPNLSLLLESVKSVAAGIRVRVIRTNKDHAAQDLYSTIIGQEI